MWRSWEQRQETWGLLRSRSGSGHACAPLLPGCGFVTRVCVCGIGGPPPPPLSAPPSRFPLSPPGRLGPVGDCLLARNEPFGAGLALRGAGRKLGKRGCAGRGQHPPGGGFCGECVCVCLFRMFFIPLDLGNWAGPQTSAPSCGVRVLPRDAGWKFAENPGTAGGAGGGSAPGGGGGDVLYGVPHPTALGVGWERGQTPCAPSSSTENAGTLEIPTFPP